jgi:ABC-type antimicrobial peptide transport system permease subunit
MGTRSLGRLKPGVSIQQAQADLNNIAKNLADAYPDSNKGSGIEILSLKSDVVGDVRTILLVLLGAVTFVLLIACANVANLLLARSTGRTREFAIRSALGASPWCVVRQLLTESLILGTVGGFLVVAVKLAPAVGCFARCSPRADEIHMDWHVSSSPRSLRSTSIIFALARPRARACAEAR